MENKNLPELHNPMMDLMQGNMPGLPQIIQNAMPVALPRMNYNDNPVSMIFGNFKRTRLEKATALEAQIAENSCRALQAKFTAIHEVVTFSAKVADTLGEYEHKKTMRSLEVQEKNADIYIKQAQARQMGFEANLSELDYNIKLKQYQKMETENE
jgi:hypothetical protein